jgi:alpha-1,3-glucosyltransferase
MLGISKEPYMSTRCLMFQRLSVVFSEFVYYYAIYLWLGQLKPHNKSRSLLLIFNAGLLIVDSMHFQYNAMMMGILLLSILYMHQKRYILSAVLFSILLNFKHIFLYFVTLT